MALEGCVKNTRTPFSASQDRGSFVQNGEQRKQHGKIPATIDDDELLTDTTSPLILISKRTKRHEKQALKRQTRLKQKTIASFLDLPAELLLEILSWLPPRDISSISQLNHSTHAFIQQNETTIARSIINTRYPILSRCFPLPFLTSSLSQQTQSILLQPGRQEILSIHKTPYQHIPPLNPEEICSCIWCILSWNNLALILDLSHFQSHFDTRTPIPIIPRGTNPSWNNTLLQTHASLIRRAIASPLIYATLLQIHLRTTIRILTRTHRHNKHILSASGKLLPTKESYSAPVFSQRPYDLTDEEARSGQDFWLGRKGKPSYEFPFSRDVYHEIEVYCPNRKWSVEGGWKYADGKVQHDRDVEVAERWFGPGRKAKDGG